MDGFYDYITIDSDGNVKVVSSDNNPTFTSSLTLIRFSLIDYGQDVSHELLTADGWSELKEIKE